MIYSDFQTEITSLSNKIQDLASSVYKVEEYCHKGTLYIFVASYSVNNKQMEFDALREGQVDLRLIADMPSPVLIEYGKFMQRVINWETGEGDLDFTRSPIIEEKLSKLAAGLPLDADIDVTELDLTDEGRQNGKEEL